MMTTPSVDCIQGDAWLLSSTLVPTPGVKSTASLDWLPRLWASSEGLVLTVMPDPDLFVKSSFTGFRVLGGVSVLAEAVMGWLCVVSETTK